MSKERLLRSFRRLEGNDGERYSCIWLPQMQDKFIQCRNDSFDFVKKAMEMGRNDPRKIIYALKMGFALALVSLFIFWKKPLHDVSQYAIWAILTVIVMFEFSIDCVNGYHNTADLDRTSSGFMTQQALSDQLHFGCKSVIESADRENTLLNFALWEPPHGRYRPIKTLTDSKFLQEPPEKRHVFRSQLQRVGEEGAKVLLELGSKLEKIRSYAPQDNILKRVQGAGEQLQKKLHQMSSLLINSESWEIIRDQTKELEDLDNHPNDRDGHQSMHLGVKSISETSICVNSSLLSAGTRLPNQDLPKHKLRKHVPWPSWIAYEGDDFIKEDEVKTYHSASSLSLATFLSLLMEFVARLQNVVDAFEELSDEAEFRDPNIIELPAVKSPGVWARVLRGLRLKI
ncbi:aluminum-activated malate transporter 9 [Dorcoceras hygrometricum]|uniref:Aluminum-activated malate transporter 9 n=1 Tax=Dorcoceras hygrometricum TaxID=472368 RepID=A0A2Z7CUM8_9LAMI|nr:aluminum-activated malate transporter 9 [Dorcoceras hygrometricum]